MGNSTIKMVWHILIHIQNSLNMLQKKIKFVLVMMPYHPTTLLEHQRIDICLDLLKDYDFNF